MAVDMGAQDIDAILERASVGVDGWLWRSGDPLELGTHVGGRYRRWSCTARVVSRMRLSNACTNSTAVVVRPC